MLFFIILLLVLIISGYVLTNHLVIRLDTFFRKGFKKNNDKYGVYCWVGKQRRWKNLFNNRLYIGTYKKR